MSPRHHSLIVPAKYLRSTAPVAGAMTRVLREMFGHRATGGRADAAESGRRPIGAVRICPTSCSPAPDNFFVPCTPARWGAVIWRSQSRPIIGPGGRFQREPLWNRLRNHQSIEIFRFSARFHRFHACGLASCAHGRVRRRAHMYEGSNTGTLEPLSFIHVNEWLNGSTVVPKRFQFGTGRIGRAAAAAIVRRGPIGSNIISGGYARPTTDQADQHLFGRGARQNFWGRRAAPGGRSAWTAPIGLGAAEWRKTGVSEGSKSAFGYGRSDIDAQRIGIAALSSAEQKLSQLPERADRRAPGAEGRGGLARPAGPPGPPFLTSLAPRMRPHAVFRKTIEPRSIAAMGRIGVAPNFRGSIGSGCRQLGGKRQSGGRNSGRGLRTGAHPTCAKIETLWRVSGHVN